MTAQQNLARALQDLHRSAGLPSSRAITAAVRDRDDLRDSVSHETVAAILRGESLPRWSKLECVVRQLADWATHRPDPAAVVLEIQELWLACRSPRPDDEPTAETFEDAQAVSKAVATQAQMETGLLIVNDDASLSYIDDTYEVSIVRNVLNRGANPLTEYPVKIAVSRYPEKPERSRQHHRRAPLSWSEIAFEGSCDGRPMAWRSTLNSPDAKGIMLLFENADEQFPLLPGQSANLSYTYSVKDDKWGQWFSRKIMAPTQLLSITAIFPARLKPVVWGERVEPLMTDSPTRIPIRHREVGPERLSFNWTIPEPTLRSSYRLYWGFRSTYERGGNEAR